MEDKKVSLFGKKGMEVANKKQEKGNKNNTKVSLDKPNVKAKQSNVQKRTVMKVAGRGR